MHSNCYRLSQGPYLERNLRFSLVLHLSSVQIWNWWCNRTGAKVSCFFTHIEPIIDHPYKRLINYYEHGFHFERIFFPHVYDLFLIFDSTRLGRDSGLLFHLFFTFSSIQNDDDDGVQPGTEFMMHDGAIGKWFCPVRPPKHNLASGESIHNEFQIKKRWGEKMHLFFQLKVQCGNDSRKQK